MQTFVIYPKTKFQGKYVIGPFCLIGLETDEASQQFLQIGPYAQIRSHTILYFGSIIGSHFVTGHHVLIREFCEIGDHVSIGTSAVVEHHVKIGSRVRIHSSSFIPEFSILEDDCWIGPNVALTNAKYPRSIDVKSTLKGPIICQGAKIGASATILPGIRIGAYALVGAGAVVTKDIPDFAVVAGNPAKMINHLFNLPYEEASRENTTR